MLGKCIEIKIQIGVKRNKVNKNSKDKMRIITEQKEQGQTTFKEVKVIDEARDQSYVYFFKS